MRKIASIISCALVLLAPSMAFSYENDKHHCHEDEFNFHNFHGSFVGLQGSIPANPITVTPDDAILNQFLFNEDRTLYVNSTNAIVFPITTGAFIPQIGTWQSTGTKHIIATVISGFADPTGGDVNLSQYTRTTYRIKVISRDQLLLEHRVTRTFALNENPLVDEGTVVVDERPNLTLNRVEVIRGDL